jgi:hypothetical protein
MVRNLLASSAIVALVAGGALAVSEAAADTQPGPTWQLAEMHQQPAEPPAAAPEAEPAEPEAAETPTDEPEAEVVEEPTDEPTPDVAEAPEPTPTETFVTEQQETEWLSSELVGSTVYNRQDEAIGQISYLIIDEEGRVVGAIVGVGGFLGIGQKKVGVHFDAIEARRDMDGQLELVMDGTREQLEEAPDFTTLAQIQREREMDMQQPPPGAPGAPGAPMGTPGVPGQ